MDDAHENISKVFVENEEHIPVDEKWSLHLLGVAVATLIAALLTIFIAVAILYIEPRFKKKGDN